MVALNTIKIISQSFLRDIERGTYNTEEFSEDIKEIVNQVNKMSEIIDHMELSVLYERK